MLKSADIRQAIGRLIKVDAALPLKVYFNRVADKPKYDYAWVKFKPARRDEGFGMFARNIRVDIMIVLLPDKNTEISHEKLLDIADALDEATCGYLKIKEIYSVKNPDNPEEEIEKFEYRNVTIYETSANIFDGILTYSFELNFADYCDKFFKTNSEAYEFMQHLSMKLNGNEYSSP